MNKKKPRVLIINKFLYHRGGDCTYTFSLGDLLRKHGIDILYWGMKHPSNYEFTNSDMFADNIDYEKLNRNKSLKGGIEVLKRSIYSVHAKEKLREQLNIWTPDLIHLNNIHSQLTPSILDEINKRHIPVVWTVHDYELICPNIHFIANGKICEDCKNHKYYKVTINKCKKSSFTASSITSIKAYVHELLNIRGKVDRFIIPSIFMYNKFIDFGWNKNKLIFIRNFLSQDHIKINNPPVPSNYVVYFGGLSPWKGINTLIEAMSKLPSITLKIIGGGVDYYDIKEKIANNSLKNIKILGRKEGNELFNIVSGAKFSIIPSEWYENCPYSIMESLSMGVPVIGADIGGIPEIVKDGYNGLLFKSGDKIDLQEKIEYLFFNSKLRNLLSENAKIYAAQEFSETTYFLVLRQLYMNISQLTI